MDFTAQAIGIIAMGLGMLSFQMKNTKKILLVQIFSTLIFGTHYFLIGGYAGAALNILSMIRNIIFYFKEKKWAKSKIWIYVFTAVFAVAAYLSGDGWLGILPFLGCTFMTIAVYFESGKTTRQIIWLSSPCWLIYNYITGSIGGVIAEVFNLTSIVISILRNDIKRKK